MSPRLPRLTGKKLVKALQKAGFACKRIEGSHHIMQKTFPEGTVTTLCLSILVKLLNWVC